MQVYRIGEALFCPLRRRILIDENEHCLEPRVSRLLEALIGADLPMSRESLLDEIWGKDGSDEALTQAVSKLRRALGDTARPYKVIETLPKQGYQLRALVEPDRHVNVASREVRTTPSFKGLLAKVPMPSVFIRGLLVGASVVLAGIIAFLALIGPRSNEVEIECPANATGEECLAIVQAVVARE